MRTPIRIVLVLQALVDMRVFRLDARKIGQISRPFHFQVPPRHALTLGFLSRLEHFLRKDCRAADFRIVLEVLLGAQLAVSEQLHP